MATGEYKNEYSKKPLWQWVLIYLIVGGIIYALIYYFVFAKKGGYTYSPSTYTPVSSSAPAKNLY